MALLTVLEYPDKRLRNKALAVSEVDAGIKKIVADMFETMYQEDAVGLAAIQVNIAKRIIVMDMSEDKSAPICVINPEIIHREGIQYEFEACVSLPGAYDKVERALKVRMRGLDQDGKEYELEAEGLLAKCIQHEIDHLDGILFIDHLSRLKQERNRKRVEKLRSQVS